MAEVEAGKGKAHTHPHHRQQAEVGEAEVVPTCTTTAAEGMVTEAEEVAGEQGTLPEAVRSLSGVGVAGIEAEEHQGAAGTSPYHQMTCLVEWLQFSSRAGMSSGTCIS